MSKPDLQHRDWLLYSQERLIRDIDPNISVDITTTATGVKQLVVTNISEASLGKLKFITNTDQNNNYLYLYCFKVFIFGSPTPLNIDGLCESVINIFRNSDINSFINQEKVFQPFKNNNFNDSSISEFVDNYTSLSPLSPKTSNLIKTYKLLLNLDNYCEVCK